LTTYFSQGSVATYLRGGDSLPVRRSKRGTCYGNVAGWLAGYHTTVLYQNG